MTHKSSMFLAFVLTLCCVLPAVAADSGRIEGRVTSEDQDGYVGVTVVIHETQEATITDATGSYSFADVPAGAYTLIFTHGKETETKSDVAVVAGSTSVVDLLVEWEFSFVESLTVYSASRRQERIVEAPAAVTVVSEEQIAREASHGQVPKLLEFTPGVEVTQSGIYDYNLNTRGFNSFSLDDIASLEMVRGPSAALYGANASSGVLNLTTKQPRYSEGGLVRLTGGELNTFNVDFRWAGKIGGGWWAKVNAGLRDHGDFSVSRNGAAEYSVPCGGAVTTDCLPQEAVPLTIENDDQIAFGGVRFDRYLDNGMVFTIEGGLADIEGPVFQTGIGRVHLIDVQRPWARFNFSSDHWNAMAYYNKRDAKDQLAMASGEKLVLDSNNASVEVQTHWDLGNTVRVVGGGSYTDEEIDSLDPATGRQTLVFEPIQSDRTALFGQLDWQASDKIKLVVAGRWDDSDLHDSQFSPKAALVYSINDNHSLRFTYNEAFQVANYSEFFLQASVALPVDLAAIEAAVCTPFGVSCGFDTPTRVLGVGNVDLELEEIQTFELGYSGIIGNKSFLTLDYYVSDNKNFITDLIPQINSMTGARTNPNFQAYVPPAAHPMPALLIATLQGALGSTYAILSNNLDDSPILTAVSYTNFGAVDTQGIDVSLRHYINNAWNLSLGYSWFDFEVKDSGAAPADQLLPNSPENKANFALSYAAEKLDAGISARWVDDFRWVVGPFQGNVESYTTVDLSLNYKLNNDWKVGLNVSNLLDNGHWESFGGDLLERRALAHVEFGW